jgi:hypothetical protein
VISSPKNIAANKNPKGMIKIPIVKFGIRADFFEFINQSKQIFDYNKFSSSRDNWGPYPFIDLLDNTVCPYCNRSYTHSVFEAGIHGGRPELDHFLSKSIFPFFGLSIYNLIPVCHSCNHSKLDRHVCDVKQSLVQYTHLHPNIIADNVIGAPVFETTNKGDLIDFLMRSDFSLQDKITISEDSRSKTKIRNSLETYNLVVCKEGTKSVYGFYSNHYKDIERTLNLVKTYPSSAIKSIASLLNEDAALLQKVFVKSLITDTPWDEPLGKLKNDLLTGIIESWEEEAKHNS